MAKQIANLRDRTTAKTYKMAVRLFLDSVDCQLEALVGVGNVASSMVQVRRSGVFFFFEPQAAGSSREHVAQKRVV